jgi:hypothetical protein
LGSDFEGVLHVDCWLSPFTFSFGDIDFVAVAGDSTTIGGGVTSFFTVSAGASPLSLIGISNFSAFSFVLSSVFVAPRGVAVSVLSTFCDADKLSAVGPTAMKLVRTRVLGVIKLAPGGCFFSPVVSAPPPF